MDRTTANIAGTVSQICSTVAVGIYATLKTRTQQIRGISTRDGKKRRFF